MTRKIKTWLPSRPSMMTVSYEQPGMLLEDIKTGILKHLKESEVEVEQVSEIRDLALKNSKPQIDCSDIDAFVWFGEIGRDSRRELNLEILKGIEKDCKVINPTQGYEIAMDKYLTNTRMREIGVRTPDYMLVNRENVEGVVEQMADWDAVLLKPRLGGYGIGIVKIDRSQDIIDIVDYSPPAVHLAERFIPNNPESWIGINMIGGKHAYSYRKGKESFKDGWKVFDRGSVGGKMLLATPTQEQIAVAEKIATDLRMAWVGIDMITDSQGKSYVIDVNAFPGLYPEMFEQAGVDGPKMMADSVLAELGV